MFNYPLRGLKHKNMANSNNRESWGSIAESIFTTMMILFILFIVIRGITTKGCNNSGREDIPYVDDHRNARY